MAAEWPDNFIADVPGTEPDVFGFSDPEVDVAGVHAFRNDNTEMITGNEPA